jgi:hypothetical protein
MKSHAMRRAEKEIKSRKEIEGIIKKAKVCRVGFVDEKKPYVLPFNFGYEKGTFFIHCAVSGRKLELLRKNKNVCVEIDGDHELKGGLKEACRSGFKYRSVVCEGKADIIRSGPGKITALNAIMKQQTGKTGWKYIEESVRRTLIIRIRSGKLSGKKSGY